MLLMLWNRRAVQYSYMDDLVLVVISNEIYQFYQNLHFNFRIFRRLVNYNYHYHIIFFEQLTKGLKLIKTYYSDTEVPILDLHLSIASCFISFLIYNKHDGLDIGLLDFWFQMRIFSVNIFLKLCILQEHWATLMILMMKCHLMCMESILFD